MRLDQRAGQCEEVGHPGFGEPPAWRGDTELPPCCGSPSESAGDSSGAAGNAVLKAAPTVSSHVPPASSEPLKGQLEELEGEATLGEGRRWLKAPSLRAKALKSSGAACREMPKGQKVSASPKDAWADRRQTRAGPRVLQGHSSAQGSGTPVNRASQDFLRTEFRIPEGFLGLSFTLSV